jgi:PAS domain S-box-containing protein
MPKHLPELQSDSHQFNPMMSRVFTILIGVFTFFIYVLVGGLIWLRYWGYMEVLYSPQLTNIFIGIILVLFVCGWGLLYGVYRGIIKPSYEMLQIISKTLTASLKEEIINKQKLEFLQEFIQESLIDLNNSSLTHKIDISDQTQTYLNRLDELTQQNIDLMKSKDELSELVDNLQRQQSLLKLEQAKTTAIINAIPNGLIASSRDGNIFLTNKEVEQMLGMTSNEMLGRFVDKILSICVEGPNALCEDIPSKKAMAGEISKTTFSYKSPTSKQTITIENTASPILYDNTIIGVVDILRDITQEQIVERAQKEFVSLASHQLRTPITSINWNAELLLAEPNIPEDMKISVQDIYHENKRMEKLVQALLNLSRIDLGNITFVLKEISLAESIPQLLKSLELDIQKKHIIINQYIDINTPIINDQAYLDIIIGNLLSNAIKYTNANGEVSIRATLKNNEYVHIEVQDNGLGIPLQQQSQIFGRLFRADNAKNSDTDGNGLGLYIVKKLVDAMGGDIWFESEEKKGTIFFINIPITLKS